MHSIRIRSRGRELPPQNKRNRIIDRKNKKVYINVAIVSAENELESQKGGKEVMEAGQTIKTIAGTSSSFVKTTTEAGKTMYQSGKKTVETITGKKKKEGTGKNIPGVRSREEYHDRKSTYRYEKAEKNGAKNNNREKKDKSKNHSIKRRRMLNYIQNKASENPEHKDSIGNVVKDMAVMKIKRTAGRIGAIVGKKILLWLAGALGSVIVVLLPVIVIIILLYHSPFAVFFTEHNADNEETIQDVLYEYYVEFSDQVQKEADKDGYDKIVFQTENNSDVDAAVTLYNFKDVLCIYAEKYGYDYEIIEVKKDTKETLKKVFNDMNYYSVQDSVKIKENKKGEKIEQKSKIITITQKSWMDMLEPYCFDKEAEKEIKELLEIADDMELAIHTDDGDTPVSVDQWEEESRTLSGSGNGREVVKLALKKLGTPYSQAKRTVKGYYDCSSFAYYMYQEAVGMKIGGADYPPTAAEECRYLVSEHKTVKYENLQPGDLIFYSFGINGRYKNIGHVAIYCGNGKVVDASYSQQKVVYRNIYSVGNIVACGRP